MHILYLHQYFTTPEGPGGTRSWEFVRRLVRDGHHVDVLTGKADSNITLPDGVTIHSLGVAYANSMTHSARIKSFAHYAARATLSVLTSPKPDLIVASSTPLTVAIPAKAAAYLRNVPYIFEVRDVWPEVPIQLGYIRHPLTKFLARALEKIAYDGASAVIALSPGMAESVSRRTHTPITIIPNSSDIDAFRVDLREAQRRRRELGWNRPTVLYAGSFGYIYDPVWIADYAYELSKHAIGLVAYGEGALWRDARQRAAELGLNPRETFPGAKPKRHIAYATSAADAALSSVIDHPALGPASINKVFDSFAAGVPIILNHDGWLSDVAQKARAGIVVSRDARIAAQETFDFLSDQAAVSRAREASGLLGERDFSRDKHYAEFLHVVKLAIEDSDTHG